MKILHVVGARPNFMKAAPVRRALSVLPGIQQVLVHTGQHYDAGLSDVFFEQLAIPVPDYNLGVGSGSHAQQTAAVMCGLEPIVLELKPDLALVYGDVNSTLAAALVCTKLQIQVGHVEAGLRSFDRTMPEEINRVLTDQVADLLFTPSADADENLKREGIATEKIHLVGNVMIDCLVDLLPQALAHWPPSPSIQAFDAKRFGLVTLHRPSNVDNPQILASIMQALDQISREVPLLFPVHPRTRKQLEGLGSFAPDSRLKLVDPIGYLELLALQKHATLVITDSGGIQEETTFLGVPCLTVRNNTERPITVTVGTNTVVGQDMELLRTETAKILAGQPKRGGVPPLWDGRASERIAEFIRGAYAG